ncbi:hypothetical protein AOQ84DRAFT_391591 [Glonium stellatum]|uniref:Uncharacterized protein n=1 Tax=Glonium stellatum TaxID=574774 RepID=A0A8E2JP33_9PEZI|nr:hypothetical protein AOQ84DRAFT_391591 [Glonium stellatum]
MDDDRDRGLNLFTASKQGEAGRSASIEDEYQDPVPTTKYMSTNHETGATFTCTAPAGSRHAKAMRELCANVQGASLQEGPERAYSQPRLMPTQTQPSSRSMAVYNAPKIGKAQSIQRVKNPHPPKLQLRPQSADGLPAPRNTSTTFRRVEGDHEIAFHRKSVQGEVYVSAPKGSDEAEAHERMVRAQLQGGQQRLQQRTQQAVLTTISGQKVNAVSRRPYWGWGS